MSDTPRSYDECRNLEDIKYNFLRLERELAEARELLYKASHHSEYQEEIEQFLERTEE